MNNDLVLAPLRTTYEGYYKEILGIDTELDAGNDKLGKRAFVNNLMNQYKEQINVLSEAVDNYFVTTAANGGPSDDLFKVAIVNGLLKSLNDKSDVLDSVVEAAIPKDTVVEVVPPARIEELTKQRSTLSKLLSTIRSAYAALSGSDETGLPVPKARTGSRGPRAPRAISSYQFYLNGNQLPGPTNSLSTVAKSVEGWKVKDLKEFMKSKGVVEDFKILPDTWEVTLPNGVMFKAVKVEAPAIDEDDDDDEDVADD